MGKILEMQEVARADEVRVPAEGSVEERLSAMAAECNAKLAAKEAECMARFATEKLELSYDRELMEKGMASRRRILDLGVSMHKEQMEKTNKLADNLDAEIKKRVRKVRESYEKRLREALKPRTPSEAQLEELKKQLAEEKAGFVNLRQELELLKQKFKDMEEATSSDDGESDDENEESGSEEEEVHTSRGVSVKDRSAEIEHLKLCFSNAAKMRDNACTAREEMRVKCDALEKEMDEKLDEAKKEIDRLTREVGIY